MKISIITDEVSADPETAIELGAEWGIHHFELRGFFTDRAPRFSAYQKQRLRDALDEFQARIVAIGPGLFKFACPAPSAPRLPLGWMDRASYDNWAEAKRLADYHLKELLPASLDYANELGADTVVTFGFDRAGAPPGPPPEEVLNCLRLAAERASTAGIRLAVENEDGFWADTGARTAQMVQAINHPALGINWDPGNAFFADDDPYPTGYQAVRGRVQHVHFKDAMRDAKGVHHYVANGEVVWAGQIRALVADEYDGFISIETHIRPKVASARAALERLRSLIAVAQENPSTINR
ncbi:MAG TPA: sugar phosphate isomerase/epimerase family protein [Anaerolineales bacterium]|nr:sugar phosphate isomerase/epimerase family protein [Anaerolineales bacterium]